MTSEVFLEEAHLKPIHRHFINLMCDDRGELAKSQNHGIAKTYNFSFFVVEIQGAWIAVSAGHIFNDLLEAQGGGAILENWRIDDSILSDNPKMSYPISLDIEKDILSYYCEHTGIDYACFCIDNLAKLNFEQEGIRAIPREIWSATDLECFDCWILVGTPESLLVALPSGETEKHHVTLWVQRLEDRPGQLIATEYTRLYAKIRFDSVPGRDEGFDISGMSGGPVFGLLPSQVKDETISDYRLVGIQSGWDGNSSIALCEASPFLQALESTIVDWIGINGQA